MVSCSLLLSPAPSIYPFLCHDKLESGLKTVMIASSKFRSQDANRKVSQIDSFKTQFSELNGEGQA